MFEFDETAIRDTANADPAFVLAARYWDVRIGFDMETDRYQLTVRDGRVTEFTGVDDLTSGLDITITAPADAWAKLLTAVPPPWYDDILFGGTKVGFAIDGDLVDVVAPYYTALQDFVAILRAAHDGPTPRRPVADVDRRFDAAVGRYVYLELDGVQHRVYFEEAGTGDIPLVLQHTAGADGRQWRHVLEDPDYQRLYRMISYDLPFHGKSLPPTGVRWWEQEYRLTRDSVMNTVVALSAALELDRPVYMGCSIGGHLAPDLALHHPDEFRAVIGVNAGLWGGPREFADSRRNWYHPRVASDWKSAAMVGNTAPTSPEAYRRECGWVYSQGAPPALSGDVYYYSFDHDLTAEQARQIDTSKVGVYLLTGEYDPLAHDGGTAALARAIEGCEFQVIPGLGHFGAAENPEDLKPVLLPVLEKIATRYA